MTDLHLDYDEKICTTLYSADRVRKLYGLVSTVTITTKRPEFSTYINVQCSLCRYIRRFRRGYIAFLF